MQIVDAFADADEMDRQRKFVRQRHEHAAARGAVKFGHDETGDAGDLGEGLRLTERVLADGGVERQHHVMRRSLVELSDHADNFRQLLHQFFLVLQSAGGINHQNIGARGLRLLDRVISEACGVGADAAGDDG